jgi:hypothetical protein
VIPRVIDHTSHSRYALRMPPTLAQVEAQLAEGRWLRTGALAVLFGVDRTTIDNWIRAGMLAYTKTPGGQRECDPADVRRLLAERRTVHRGPQT